MLVEVRNGVGRGWLLQPCESRRIYVTANTKNPIVRAGSGMSMHIPPHSASVAVLQEPGYLLVDADTAWAIGTSRGPWEAELLVPDPGSIDPRTQCHRRLWRLSDNKEPDTSFVHTMPWAEFMRRHTQGL